MEGRDLVVSPELEYIYKNTGNYLSQCCVLYNKNTRLDTIAFAPGFPNGPLGMYPLFSACHEQKRRFPALAGLQARRSIKDLFRDDRQAQPVVAENLRAKAEADFAVVGSRIGDGGILRFIAGQPAGDMKCSHLFTERARQ